GYEPEQALQLLQSLEIVPSSELKLRSQNPRGNQLVVGWLALTWVLRQNLVMPENLPDNIATWKGRFPYHPITQADALDLWLRYRQTFSSPASVAVLLPGSGRLEAASAAIRDGFLSAYLDNPGNSRVYFLSTGEEGEMAHSAYFEALDLGVDWIIGPLQKQSIEALLKLAGLVTPFLALNDLPADMLPPAGLAGQVYGISLSQDKEVQSLARSAAESGYSKAIILAPESEWGERMAQNFREEFLQKNGKIVASSRYLESENDHSATLERLLRLDESKARKNQLENTLQMNLEFEPIRRTDVDVIFLAANSTQGRSLRPQLRFHYAGDIPVYATSRIFSGQPNRTRDQDLNGIIIPIAPMQLETVSNREAAKFDSIRGGVFNSLYALGMDSWNLLPWLKLMKRDPDFDFPGASGYYSEGEAGNLDREPAFAIFKGGLPVPAPIADGANKL
ncbi:MAG TPA: penicillin-binding protein activator, partial [Xanthomonadales bacterium]|nr:penicillin-binding protein activator [Xanthomonadales bacterium]